jgi:hypothetical protein
MDNTSVWNSWSPALSDGDEGTTNHLLISWLVIKKSLLQNWLGDALILLICQHAQINANGNILWVHARLKLHIVIGKDF